MTHAVNGVEHVAAPAVDVRAMLARLAAAPRPAGSVAEAAARAHVADALLALGFAVREEPFAYSALPGRWGTPIVGLTLMGALAAAGHVGWRWQAPELALLVLLLALGVVAALGAWLTRRGVLDLPLLRRQAVNLVATRPGAPVPRVWLVAHLDSKSQPVPMALRVTGIVGTALALAVALAVAVAQWAGVAGAAAWWPAVTAFGVVLALPVALTTVGARSDGALDNASGVATVLAAAAALPPDVHVGVLVPSAEELGLAGARAWARGWRAAGHAPGVALNVDGVDDHGALTAMWSGGRTPALAALLAAVAAASGEPVRVRRLVPGILTDGVALADAGWAAVTVSRGTWATLARIHTPADGLHRLDGRGIAGAAALVAAVAGAAATRPRPSAPSAPFTVDRLS